jgi:hypothetical protein
MKTSLRMLAVVVVLAGAEFGMATSRAHAQAFGFSYAQPGFGLSVGTGPYGGAVFPGYPAVAPAVVAPAPVVVPAPIVVPRPVLVPGPFYGGAYYGAYRPYPYYAYRHYRR